VWHREAERLGRLKIDDQLAFGRRLHGKVCRLLAPKNAIDIARRPPKLVDIIRSVGNQAPGGDEIALEVNCGQLPRV
jgi:hypothetical protein